MIWTACLEAPIINHIVRLASSQTPRQTKTLLSGRTSEGPRHYLPVAEGKGQTSLWVKIILHYTGGSLPFLKKNSESSALNILLLFNLESLSLTYSSSFRVCFRSHVALESEKDEQTNNQSWPQESKRTN